MRRTSSQFSLRSLQRGVRKLARLAQVVHGAEPIHRFHCAEGSQTVAEVLGGNGRCEPGNVYSFGDNFVHVGNVSQERRRVCVWQGWEDERQLSTVTAERVRRSGCRPRIRAPVWPKIEKANLDPDRQLPLLRLVLSRSNFCHCESFTLTQSLRQLIPCAVLSHGRLEDKPLLQRCAEVQETRGSAPSPKGLHSDF